MRQVLRKSKLKGMILINIKMSCKICHNFDFIIDVIDYEMGCKCYLYYDEHNPKVIDDFEIISIIS